MSDTFATPWILTHQAPLSMGFSRQEYWSGWPFIPPKSLPDSGIEPICPPLAGGFFTTEPLGKPGVDNTFSKEGKQTNQGEKKVFPVIP